MRVHLPLPCPAQSLLMSGQGSWGSSWVHCCHKELPARSLRDEKLFPKAPHIPSLSDLHKHPWRDWASSHFIEEKIEAYRLQVTCLGATESVRTRTKICT